MGIPTVDDASEYQRTEYVVKYSDEDGECVATSPEFPSLSWLAPTPGEAIEGLDRLIFLCALAPPVGLPAQLFPLPDGGVQIEWHNGSLDIEIECPADGFADGLVHVYMAKDGTAVIDEQATGKRAEQLLQKVRQALADAVTHTSIPKEPPPHIEWETAPGDEITTMRQAVFRMYSVGRLLRNRLRR